MNLFWAVFHYLWFSVLYDVRSNNSHCDRREAIPPCDCVVSLPFGNAKGERSTYNDILRVICLTSYYSSLGYKSKIAIIILGGFGHLVKLTFYESGAYTGLVKGCEIDTTTISKEEAERLQSLVDQSGILSFQEFQSSTSEVADRLTYEIKVEFDNTMYEFIFDQNNLPTELIPLLKYLHDCAKIVPP